MRIAGTGTSASALSAKISRWAERQELSSSATYGVDVRRQNAIVISLQAIPSLSGR